MHKPFSILFCLLFTFFLYPNQTKGQTQFVKKWDYRYGGDKNDLLSTFIQTSDKGFILAGATLSDSGFDIHEHTRGGIDFLIIKTDSSGQLQWDKRFGGTDNEWIYKAIQLNDGSFVFGGYTLSNISGDVSQASYGASDFWLVKTDSIGNKLWDKRYGGSGSEIMVDIIQTRDGGFLLGGVSDSDSTGNVSHHNHGYDDFWIVKTDSSGTIQWDKLYGGNEFDEFRSLLQVSDGSFVLCGETSSDSSGDISHHTKGLNDIWVLKIDSTGNKLWDYLYGGDTLQSGFDIIETNDHGLLIGGTTNSGISYDVSDSSRGLIDFWIIKTDSLGIKLWDKRYGGSGDEDFLGNIQQTTDGGYLLCGTSYSDSSGEKTENNLGNEQGWIVKTDSSGNKLWDKTIFTNTFIDDEVSYAIEINDGNYVIANHTDGLIGGYKSQFNYGSSDLWMVNLIDTTDLSAYFPQAGFTSSDTLFCEKSTVNFFDNSVNASAWSWHFTGAIPDTSTAQNPVNIYYPNYGIYPVSLIAYNYLGQDTAISNSYIQVVPSPAPPVISVRADTLVSSQAFAYQWYFNNQLLTGATDSFYVFTQQGSYYVIITDSNGCQSSSSITNTGISGLSANGDIYSISPNPNSGEFTISFMNTVINGQIYIIDVTGRIILNAILENTKNYLVSFKQESGIYWLKFVSDSKIFYSRLVICN